MRKLLIFVNKFDQEDDLLGFFVGWVVELAKHLESVTVISQYAGRYETLPNLRVIVIDKKKYSASGLRALRFVGLLFKLRKSYEGVFVVMAPAWAIIAGVVSRISGKKTYLWYAVWRGSWKLRLAEKLVTKIFCSVRESFPFASKRVVPIGQGVDIDYFVPDSVVRKPGVILFLGRMSPIKKIEVLLKAVSQIKNKNIGIYDQIKIELAGGPANKMDGEYLGSLHGLAGELGIAEKLNWVGRISHVQTLGYYQRSDIFVNLTPTGSFDKTILEAMACGVIVLASNLALAKFLDSKMQNSLVFKEEDAGDLADKLIKILELVPAEKEKFRQNARQIVLRFHSQTQWAKNLIQNL